MLRSRILTAAVLLSVIAGWPHSASAQTPQFTSLFVFGDSLSDSGNIFALTGGASPPSPPYFNGRFSNGPVWVENLAPALGFSFNRATNFALGGAQSGAASPIDGLNQIGGFLAAGGAIPAGALTVVWIGSNDFLINAATTPPGVLIGSTVTNVAASVTLLAGAGANTFLVPNLPRFGDSPGGAATGLAAALNGLAGLYNNALHSTMNGLQFGLGVRIMVMDVEGLFADALAAPGLYGLSNTAIPCLTPAGPTGACPTAAAAASALFWDAIHPTAATHSILAEFATATLAQFEHPRNFSAASFLGPIMMDNHFESIKGRLINLRSTGNAATGAYGAYSYADGDRSGTSTLAPFDFDFSTITAGADAAISNNFVIGGAITFVSGDSVVEGAGPSTDFDSIIGTAYTSYYDNSISLDLIAAFSADEYGFTRSTSFTPRPIANAETKGDSLFVSLEAGYTLSNDGLRIGPVAGIRYVNSDMDGFGETGAAMLNVISQDREADGWIGSVGIEIAGSFGVDGAEISPYARVSYNTELSKLKPEIVLLTSTSQPLLITAEQQHDDRVTAQAGLTFRLGREVHITVAYQGTLVHGDQHGIVGRLSYGF